MWDNFQIGVILIQKKLSKIKFYSVINITLINNSRWLKCKNSMEVLHGVIPLDNNRQFEYWWNTSTHHGSRNIPISYMWCSSYTIQQWVCIIDDIFEWSEFNIYWGKIQSKPEYDSIIMAWEILI